MWQTCIYGPEGMFIIYIKFKREVTKQHVYCVLSGKKYGREKSRRVKVKMLKSIISGLGITDDYFLIFPTLYFIFL